MMYKKGFSYAEAMVTMLIVAIIMVATTPILSKKMHAKKSQIWNFAQDQISTFYGTSPNQRVIIGANNTENESAKLIIHSGGDMRTETTTLPPIIRFINSTDKKEIGRITTTKTSLAIGTNALSETEGALDDNLNSTAIGSGALQNIKGQANTAIGANTCKNIIEGNGNICIGTNAGPEAENTIQSNRLYIDNKQTDTPLIFGIFGADSSSSSLTINGTLQAYDPITGNIYDVARAIHAQAITSDARLKNIKNKSTAGLKEINKLEVKNFTFKKDKEKTLHVGVIAQELIKIFPNSVIKDEDGYYKIKKEEMFYAMINAIKELDKKFNQNSSKMTKLEDEISKLKIENEKLTQKIMEIEQKLQEK